MTEEKHPIKKDPNIIGVLAKSLSIISVLSKANQSLGLTKIAELSKVNKTSSYRILYTLMQEQYVEPGDRPGTYQLGLRFLELGNIVQSKLNLRQVALPELQNLTRETEDTTYLCMLNGLKSVCIEKVEGKHVQVLTMNVGDTWPLYKGAAPRAILAHLPENTIEQILSDEIIPDTPKTLTEKEDLKSIIKEIRNKGYSSSYEDVTTGVSSIGAPIFNHNNEVIGSISLSSISHRLPAERDKEFGELVLKTARRISTLMGWSGR